MTRRVSAVAAFLASKPEFAGSSELRTLIVASELIDALDHWEALHRLAEEITAELLGEDNGD